MTQISSESPVSAESTEPSDPARGKRPKKYIALIPAAGVGARMASHLPKQYLDLNGKSVLQRTIDCFLNATKVDHIFVVVSADDAYVDTAVVEHPKLTILNCGGATRRDTVQNGLNVIQKFSHYQDDDMVLVHDAARPGLTPMLIEKLIYAVGDAMQGGLLALPVVDTVKRVSGNQIQTIDRSELWLAQTPQMFSIGLLTRALDLAINVTDEASAVEALGYHPKLVEGALRNRKLTVPEDLEFLTLYFKE